MNISQATNKISEIAEKKFGCPVTFTYYNQIKEAGDQFDLNVLERNIGAQFIILQNDIILPVHVQSELFGIVTVHMAANLDAIRLHSIQEFVEGTLKEYIVQVETLRRTRIVEASLEAQKFSGNVVPLSKQTVEMANLFQTKLNNVDFVSSTSIGFIGLLGGNETKLHKFAVDLHDLLDRRGFLPFLDLGWNSETFNDELLSLGKSTLYISEITKLSSDYQRLLADFLNGYQMFRSPLVIFGSQMTFEQLQVCGQVHESLLAHLSHNSVDISLLEFATRTDLQNYFQNIIGLN